MFAPPPVDSLGSLFGATNLTPYAERRQYIYAKKILAL